MPIESFTGIAVAKDGTILVAGDAEVGVLALKPAGCDPGVQPCNFG